MLFENYQRLGYAFKIEGKEQYILLRDICTNLRVRKNIINNVSLYDYYIIQDGETPDIIAHKLYGDSQLHWIIMLMNERFSYLDDFPLSSNQLSDYITGKYGAGNEYKIHYLFDKQHFEDQNGLVVDGKTGLKYTLTGVYKEYSNFPPYSLIGTSSQSDFPVGTTVNWDNGAMNWYDRMYGYGMIVENSTSTSITVSFDGGYIPSSNWTVYTDIGNKPFTVSMVSEPSDYYWSEIPLAKPVTNYDYEFALNEKKREIKILNPTFIDQVVKELSAVLEDYSGE